MAGIVSYGCYIPRYRIDRRLIYKAMGWLNPATFLPGEKAVANFDEDSLTMAVAAATDCLGDIDRNKIDAVYFATSTAPYTERQGAEIIATAIDARSDIRSADFSDTPKAGTTALLSALDAVRAGSAGKVMVCAGDTRNAKAGSAQEEIFGDAAAAILVGEDDSVARFVDFYSVSHDFPDHWRSSGEFYDHQWEDRFIRDEGYTRFVVDVLNGLANKCSLKVGQLSKVVYPCLYAGDFQKIALRLGLDPSQLVEPLLGRMGYAGTADPLLHLVKALEEARAGDKIAVVGYGTGADALLFEVSDREGEMRGARRGVAKNINAKRELSSYEKMVTWRGLLQVEKGARGETTPFTALSHYWRDRHQILGLRGTRCRSCGTPQYPAQRVCVNPECEKIDQMDTYRFSDKRGKLFTYTGDNLAFCPNPPVICGIVDFDGGGRFWFDMADADLNQVEVGMPVEMSFRKKYFDDKFGIHGYFWKAIPVLD